MPPPTTGLLIGAARVITADNKRGTEMGGKEGLGGGAEPIADDFEGADLEVRVGTSHIPGLERAVRA